MTDEEVFNHPPRVGDVRHDVLGSAHIGQFGCNPTAHEKDQEEHHHVQLRRFGVEGDA